MKYRTRSVVVEAFQMTSERYVDKADWPMWLHQAWKKPVTEIGAVFSSVRDCLYTVSPPVFLQTLEGTLKICLGDWILQDAAGDLCVRKSYIFEDLYEVVE